MDVDVVIVGAGPIGLMLAVELRLAGADPVVLDRLPAISEVPKGNGVFGQVVSVFEYRGLLDRFSERATWVGRAPRFSFGPLQLDFSGLETSPLQLLPIPQRRMEQLLEERLRELGGSVRRGHEVLGFTTDEDQDTVDVEVRGPDGDYRLRTRYLVGCDGAHSSVRKRAGIGFPGLTSPEVARIGRVTLPPEMIDQATGAVVVPGAGRLEPAQHVRTEHGGYSIAPLAMLDRDAERGVFIVSTTEQDPSVDLDSPMTLDELRASMRRVIGADLPMSRPLWLSRTVGNSRQAERYRAGRILLAGDAAHVFGVGGGLNVGLLDAVNLGWKLAADVQGRAPEGLLDTYHAERHAVGRRVLMHTRAQRALGGQDEYVEALRELFGELIALPDVARRLGELIQGSDPQLGGRPAAAPRHPLEGRLAPDLELDTAEGAKIRVAELLRAARPVLLDLTLNRAPSQVAAAWGGAVTVVVAYCPDRSVPADALLIRPDGQVAWAAGPQGSDPTAGLEDVLRTWFVPTPSA
jgi:2-polyprenyl-6-methoxyphenol hydroxylase-like FAD-dependent oxidoreductase